MNFNDLVNEQPLLSDIMDTILDGVVTIEHSDTFTYANAGAARIFGVSREELTTASSARPAAKGEAPSSVAGA